MASNAEQLVQNASSLLKLIGLAVAALIPLIFPAEVIPSQLSGLTASSSLLGVLAFLAAVNFAAVTQRFCRAFTIIALICGVLTVVLNQAFVISLEIGEPSRSTPFLTGWSHSEEGRRIVNEAGVADEAASIQIARVGHDQIPRLYGASYTVNLWVYSAALLLLVFSSVFALVGTSVGERDARASAARG